MISESSARHIDPPLEKDYIVDKLASYDFKSIHNHLLKFFGNKRKKDDEDEDGPGGAGEIELAIV